MKTPPRHGLDDLRRFATSLAEAVGVTRVRAATWASQLLWYDSHDHGPAGIAALPAWLERIERGEVDPKAEGVFGVERAGTAVLDGRNGIGPLIMARGAAVAVEKSRDVGVGLVRVVHLGSVGPTAAIAAEVAVGPSIVAILGPGRSLASAVPVGGRPPLVYDSTLVSRPISTAEPDGLAAILSALMVPDGWLIAAFSAQAMEPLETLHARMASFAKPAAGRGRASSLPADGIALKPAVVKELRRAAGRLGVAWPVSLGA